MPSRRTAVLVALPVAGLAALALALVLGAGGGSEHLAPRQPQPVRIDPAALTGPDALPGRTVEVPAGDDERRVVVEGSGWGHSVGMSQYGAEAQARAGRTDEEILAHYYPGTSVEAHPAADRELRVGLFRNRAPDDADRLRLTAVGRGGEAPGHPVEVHLDGEMRHVPAGDVWTLEVAGDDRLVLVDADGGRRLDGAAPARLRFGSIADAPTLLRLPQLARSGSPRSGTFRWGTVEVAVADGEVRPTLVVPLERYLRGLAEMPPSWEPHALRAQAIAGRTYAVRMVLDGRKADCDCHLGATPHDQAYTGWEQEGAQLGGRWVEAVDATTGRVVTHEDELAWTFYSSSHGGRTEAAPDSWAYDEAQDHPYLVSVDDPWSLDPDVGNPRASWEVELPADAFARVVGLARLDAVEILERTDGGSPSVLRVAGTDLAGNAVDYAFRGWRTGIAASDLKLAFRELLPSQQITGLELAEP